MAWETVESKGAIGTTAIPNDQVSIGMTRTKGKAQYRMFVKKCNFAEDVKYVILKHDKENNRLGVFKPEDSKNSRSLCSTTSRKTIYISLPRDLVEKKGFVKGRYKIKKNDKIANLYFYIKMKPLNTSEAATEE